LSKRFEKSRRFQRYRRVSFFTEGGRLQAEKGGFKKAPILDSNLFPGTVLLDQSDVYRYDLLNG